MDLKVKITDKKLTPFRAHNTAAGLDLRAAEDYTLRIGDTRQINTGTAVEIPPGYFGLCVLRSGFAKKEEIILMNGAGIIDSDYRGTIGGTLYKVGLGDGAGVTKINAGDRILQLLIVPCALPDIVLVDELDETVRGAGGFGSTGVA